MRWLKRTILAVITLLVLVMALIFITPLDTYIPEIERRVGAQIQEPVRVGAVQLGLFPLPHLDLKNVRVGRTPSLQADEVEIELSLVALMSGELVLHRVSVSGGVVYLHELQLWLARFISFPHTQSIRFTEFQFRGVTLMIKGVALDRLEGKVELDERGQLRRIWLAADEQKLVVSAVPVATKVDVQHLPVLAFEVHGKNWQPPLMTDLPLMEHVEASGVLDGNKVDVRLFNLSTSSAHATGSALLDFAMPWRVSAELKESEISLPPILAMLNYPATSRGTFQARGAVQSEGASLDEMQKNLRFNGRFALRQAEVNLVKETGKPFVIDALDAQLGMDEAVVSLSDIHTRLYDGQASGKLMLDRATLGLSVQGVVKNVNLQPLIASLSSEVLLSGRADAQTEFRLQLRDFEKFPANVRLQADFQMRNGVLQKVDLEQVAKNPAQSYASQGATKFDQLNGRVQVDGNGYHFRQIALASGSLNAEGRLDVSPNMALKGMLDADVKGTAGLVSMPMVISGTLDKPSVSPSGTALAGAAVGTAMLGPGLGTALGVKIGGFLHKLFGSDDAPANKKAMHPKQSEKPSKP
ncbi:MAG: AsmA family protein [Gallionella sp.]|nr:AsmA family protein [Gallionella sp.]